MNSSDERCCGRRFTPCSTSDLELADYQEIRLQERRKSNELATDSQAIAVILRAGLVNSCDPGGRYTNFPEPEKLYLDFREREQGRARL